jgi:hypothetical protein
MLELVVIDTSPFSFSGAFMVRSRSAAIQPASGSMTGRPRRRPETCIADCLPYLIGGSRPRFLDLQRVSKSVGITIRALTTLYRLFRNCDASEFETRAPLPIIEFGDTPEAKVMSGFGLAFIMKFDIARLKQTDMSFIF